MFAGVCLAETQEAENKDLHALQQQAAEMQQQIDILKKEIELLKQGKGKEEQASAPQKETIAVSPQKPAAAAPQSFNPEISAIGDVLFHAGKNDENEKKNQFQFREVEIGISAPVDPYGRADFFIHTHEHEGEWHTGLCEGYFTFLTLPYDLQSRIGKFRSSFGKANQMHTHNMPWVDRPSVINNFFGEEGMNEQGAELSWLAPNPWDSFIELTAQIQNNGNDASFAGEESDGLMYVTHLKNFFDIDRNSTIEVGGSFATGHNAAEEGGNRTHIGGIDLTYKWRHPQQGLYESLTWMSEALFSSKEQGAENTVDSYGLYSSLEYQFARRWSVFGRYDYSQFPDDDDSHENAFSTGLTFKQSEFCFWRLQYKHTESKGIFTTDNSRDELFLQLDFGIGPHRAHQY